MFAKAGLDLFSTLEETRQDGGECRLQLRVFKSGVVTAGDRIGQAATDKKVHANMPVFVVPH